MYDYKELCSKIVILVVLQSMVHYYPDLKKYNNETLTKKIILLSYDIS